MVFQIILVVELLSTSWTEVFAAHPLLVNISEVSHQIISQKKLLLTDAAGNVKILFSASVSLLHVVVELHSTCETINTYILLSTKILLAGPDRKFYLFGKIGQVVNRITQYPNSSEPQPCHFIRRDPCPPVLTLFTH